MNRNNNTIKSLKVTNLPVPLTEELISLHFSRFGDVKSIVIETSNEAQVSGTARIKLVSSLTYDYIINQGLKSSNFKVERLFQPIDAKLAQRKICLFGVPKSYKSRKLKKIFQNEFGNVENAYIRKTRSRLFNYGFVTFSDAATAQKALLQKIVVVNDTKESKEVEIEVRKFFTKSEKNGKNFENEENFKNGCNRKNLPKNDTSIENKPGSRHEFSERKNNYHVTHGYQVEKTNTSFPKFKGEQNITHKKENKALGQEEEELKYLSKFTFMPPRRLRLYIQKVSQNMNRELTFTEIQQLELFNFNRRDEETGKVGKKRALKSKKLTKKVNDNHGSQNILLNRNREESRGLKNKIIARRIRRGVDEGEDYYCFRRETRPSLDRYRLF